jgi:hypothetical protein
MVEPVCEELEIEKGRIYILKAYEIISSDGAPKGWDEDIQQFDYNISRKIVIKNP